MINDKQAKQIARQSLQKNLFGELDPQRSFKVMRTIATAEKLSETEVNNIKLHLNGMLTR